MERSSLLQYRRRTVVVLDAPAANEAAGSASISFAASAAGQSRIQSSGIAAISVSASGVAQAGGLVEAIGTAAIAFSASAVGAVRCESSGVASLAFAAVGRSPEELSLTIDLSVSVLNSISFKESVLTSIDFSLFVESGLNLSDPSVETDIELEESIT